MVVGNGLAGACLCLQLHGQGKRLLVFDTPDQNVSSAVAAGLFNPITGKVMKETWMADTLFSYLPGFYRWAERLLGRTFFHPVGIYRPFLSVAELNDWMVHRADAFPPEAVQVQTGPHPHLPVNDAHGGLLLPQSGYVNVSVFLDAVRHWLDAHHTYRPVPFDYAELKLTDEGVQYADATASKIVFCEGLGIQKNPWLAALPVRPLKGEVLLIRAPGLPAAPIVNRGVYLVPQANGLFRVGATYQSGDNTLTVTEKGRETLTEGLKSLLRCPFEVLGQEAGLRPTVPDRRPLLGPHPQFEQIIVFNGLGTKGVSLAPYLSGVVAAWLAGKQALPAEACAERFNHLFLK
jgi:glycine/D-amino acid oxidase-like deaminating enzyme